MGADIRVDSTSAVSGCHLSVGFDEWGRVIIRDPSKFGSKVIYTQLPHVNSTGIPYPQRHESCGNGADPPQWVVPVGWTVGMALGQSETQIVFQVPDHSYHMHEYQRMVRQFQAYQNNMMPFLGGLALESRAITTGDILPAAERSAPDRKKGRYAWIIGDKRLGRGASSQVFEVFNSSNWARCAGKRVQKYPDFQHEYALMSTLEHRYIARYIDIQEIQGSDPMIIMEYCDLGSLYEQHRWICFKGNEIMVIMTQAFAAVDYLHSHNITHRDLKPDNILIRSREPLEIAVSDFGLSKQGESNMGTFVGTQYYMAPEVLLTRDREIHGGLRHIYKNSSDIWSLGVIAVELTHGGMPNFNGHRIFDLEYCDAMSRLGADLLLESLQNPYFAGLVWEMLSWDPDDRPTAAGCLSRVPALRLDNEADLSERSCYSVSGSQGVNSASTIRHVNRRASDFNSTATQSAQVPAIEAGSATVGPNPGFAYPLARQLGEDEGARTVSGGGEDGSWADESEGFGESQDSISTSTSLLWEDGGTGIHSG
ncbi:hypothetical protein INS49_004923 [Diaporthe citri]|uniref:uncharacterized protein n=1 Tax=Diaporthe citri TaxID=83186 RepID=UPI001C82797B|nr:uncharacterized protein INS49_004923 [Diaporthe citri]KAG6354318.1 hypothetical protein INS49_004923 [Diaporthe citri]